MVVIRCGFSNFSRSGEAMLYIGTLVACIIAWGGVVAQLDLENGNVWFMAGSVLCGAIVAWVGKSKAKKGTERNSEAIADLYRQLGTVHDDLARAKRQLGAVQRQRDRLHRAYTKNIQEYEAVKRENTELRLKIEEYEKRVAELESRLGVSKK